MPSQDVILAFSINRVRKATIFKKLLSKTHLQEAALVFTASSKLQE